MPSDTVQQIKDRLNIVDVVGQYVKLRKAGQNFVARCPFHNEKTPSFNVSPTRNAYYCFGCGAKGDAFSFVEHFEGVDFVGALKILGDRAGVKVTFSKDHKKRRDEREKLFEILEIAAVFFEANLKTNKKVFSYLTGRGLSERTIGLWRLGYASREWRVLHEHLREKGYSDTDIEAAGLIKKKEKGERYYDRFRGRIMFPISDPAGRVIAFTGRIFPDDKNSAKYVNSPETALYEKSRVLYGYDKAKFSIRKHDFSILVEGQLDVLMSFQSGYTNTVAVSGTALSRDQLTLLHRLSGNIVFGFDADAAGAASAGKSAALALSMGLDVKVAALPKGTDPADLVAEGVDGWKKAVKGSKHIIDFSLDLVFESETDVRKRRLMTVRQILPFIVLVPNKVDQAHFISRIALRLSVPETAIREELFKVPHNALLSDMFSDSAVSALESAATAEALPHRMAGGRQEQIETALVALIRTSDNRKTYEKKLRNIVGVRRFEKLCSEEHAPTDADLFALESRILSGADRGREIDELLLHLEKEYLVDARKEITAALRQAEADNDRKKTDTLALKHRRISSRLLEIEECLMHE